MTGRTTICLVAWLTASVLFTVALALASKAMADAPLTHCNHTHQDTQ